MPIDFHSPTNRLTYAQRNPGAELEATIGDVVDPGGTAVVDLGCGGGVYTAAWRALGARHVAAVDFSPEILSGAREHLGTTDPAISFHLGNATATGLPDRAFDVVFARALIHHLPDLRAFAREAARLLRGGGTLIVQDRTVDDVDLPASDEHVRGHFFTVFPHLREIERGRRPRADDLTEPLHAAGFENVETRRLWETRRTYTGHDEIAADLRARTGRSLLHDLTDEQLELLVEHVLDRVHDGALVERDPWTLWVARRRDRPLS